MGKLFWGWVVVPILFCGAVIVMLLRLTADYLAAPQKDRFGEP